MAGNDYSDNNSRNTYTTGGYGSYDGMGYNRPSFSNSSDASNIKKTIDRSRAEQVTNGRGVARDDDSVNSNNNNNRSSELGDKEGLDDKRDTLASNNNNTNNDIIGKDDNSNKGLLGGKSDSGKFELNPFKKLKKKFSVLKMKIYLILAAIAVAALIILFIVGFFVSLFGGIASEGSDKETYEQDPYDEDIFLDDNGEHIDLCFDENGEDCLEDPRLQQEEEEETEYSDSDSEYSDSETDTSEEEDNGTTIDDSIKPNVTKPTGNVPLTE